MKYNLFGGFYVILLMEINTIVDTGGDLNEHCCNQWNNGKRMYI